MSWSVETNSVFLQTSASSTLIASPEYTDSEMFVMPPSLLFARIALDMEDKGKCMHLCDSPEIHENDKVCSGSPPSQCRTQLSCGTKGCACWLKLQCNGGTGGNPSDGKVSVHTRDRRSPFIAFSAFVNIG